jgi:hypothetical protein
MFEMKSLHTGLVDLATKWFNAFYKPFLSVGCEECVESSKIVI